VPATSATISIRSMSFPDLSLHPLDKKGKLGAKKKTAI
jgi:hypothetical protein